MHDSYMFLVSSFFFNIKTVLTKAFQNTNVLGFYFITRRTGHRLIILIGQISLLLCELLLDVPISDKQKYQRILKAMKLLQNTNFE